MIKIYFLKIRCNGNNLRTLWDILELDKYKNIEYEYQIELDKDIFEFKIEIKNNNIYFDYINFFLDILEKKYNLLEEIWVKREDISIWKLYWYDNQCNMEWWAEELKRLWNNWISLCVSCWEISQ